MDNPYAPPKNQSDSDVRVEVVSRSVWVWKWAGQKYEQVYRFRTSLAKPAITTSVLDFYLRQNCHVLSKDTTSMTFERTGKSLFHQIFQSSEIERPQQIKVSLDLESDRPAVTCAYHLQFLFPDFLHPPHMLEVEVNQLARELPA